MKPLPGNNQTPQKYASARNFFKVTRNRNGGVTIHLTAKAQELARNEIFALEGDVWGEGITFIAVCRMLDNALRRTDDTKRWEMGFDLDDELPF